MKLLVAVSFGMQTTVVQKYVSPNNFTNNCIVLPIFSLYICLFNTLSNETSNNIVISQFTFICSVFSLCRYLAFGKATGDNQLFNTPMIPSFVTISALTEMVTEDPLLKKLICAFPSLSVFTLGFQYKVRR